MDDDAMSKPNTVMWRRWAMVIFGYFLAGPAVAAPLQAVCRLKGQEPNRLQGLGIVVGLNGTGDSRLPPTSQALARLLQRSGNHIQSITELSTVRNVALVWVSCEVPAAGGREGDRFDCFVTSLGGARSLVGGRLVVTPLTGPLAGDETVLALAEGALTIEETLSPNHAIIYRGARLTEDLLTPYLMTDVNQLTLVIDDAHATFVTASRIAEVINRAYQAHLEPPAAPSGSSGLAIRSAAHAAPPTERPKNRIAYPLDAKNVVVHIPEFMQRDVVRFVHDLMELDIDMRLLHTEPRIVINERTGTITVTGEVQFPPLLVTHKNLVIRPAGQAALGQAPPNEFVALTPAGGQGQPPLPVYLNDLLVALNQAQVTTVDKIAIIKQLEKTGKLHAKLILE
jgi:flagellar P-ring protein precursor FlgI